MLLHKNMSCNKIKADIEKRGQMIKNVIFDFRQVVAYSLHIFHPSRRWLTADSEKDNI